MKFPYIVNLNGVVYPAGAEVPVGIHSMSNKQDEETETVLENSKQYTRSEIQLMRAAELQDLANSEGIPDAYETSGNKLKSILLEHFGL